MEGLALVSQTTNGPEVAQLFYARCLVYNKFDGLGQAIMDCLRANREATRVTGGLFRLRKRLGGLVGFGAAGGEEVAVALGFVAEEVDAEGELGAGFDAFLVGVVIA